MQGLFRALLGLAAVWVCTACTTPALQGRVVGVTDGDTVKVLVDDKPVTVRLFAIDAPETTCHAWNNAEADKHCVDRGQPYAKDAKQYLSSLVLGKIVKVSPTGELAQQRTVATLWVGDLDVNLEMVKAGYACHYMTYARRHQTPEQFAAYARAEQSAREHKAGQWQNAAARCGWQYRNEQRHQAP